MSKSKHGKQEEFYLGQIRELKKENKRLKQQLRQSERNNVFKVSPKVLEKAVLKSMFTCEACGKGELTILDLGNNRKYQICSLCKDRRKI